MLLTEGVGELVEAARICRREIATIRVVLVGRPEPGNLVSIPESTLSAWVEEGAVECWGHRDDMPEIYARAPIVILPSHREGLPRSVLVAGAMMRPVISTDVQGCRDVGYNGKSGVLVPSRDPAALVRAILRFEAIPRCGGGNRSGRTSRVLHGFLDDVIVKRTLELYGRARPGFGHAPRPTVEQLR